VAVPLPFALTAASNLRQLVSAQAAKLALGDAILTGRAHLAPSRFSFLRSGTGFALLIVEATRDWKR
jgi:hypothetical protein